LTGEVKEGDRVAVDAGKDGLTFRASRGPGKRAAAR
jgi:hypothetical protein